MLALVAPFFIGLVLSSLTGGQLSRLRRVRFRGTLLASLALLAQIFLFSPALETRGWAIQYGPYVYVLSMLVVALVIAANVRWQFTPMRRAALAIASLGVLLNCVVVGANGAYMPRITTDAHPAVPGLAEAGRLVNVVPMTEDTRLWWLGDILSEPGWWPLSNVLSIGDVLLATGLAVWAMALTRSSERRPPSPANPDHVASHR